MRVTHAWAADRPQMRDRVVAGGTLETLERGPMGLQFTLDDQRANRHATSH